MIIYNITFHVEKEVVEDGLVYLKRNYIPDVVGSGLLHTPLLRRVMLMPEEEEGESYAVQFQVESLDTLNGWLAQEGRALHHKLVERFSHKIVGFATLLEELDCEL